MNKAQLNSVDLKATRSILAAYKVGICAIADKAVSLSKEKRALEVLLSEKQKAYSAIVTGDLSVIGTKVDELEGYKSAIKDYSLKLATLKAQLDSVKKAQQDELSKGINWLRDAKVYEAYCESEDAYAIALCNAIPGFGMKDFNAVSLRKVKASNKKVVKSGGMLTTTMSASVFYDSQLRILADYFGAVLPEAKFTKAALEALKRK
jgi:hypothetical protein